MTLHKLAAGSGYEYLTNQVAALDATNKGATPLADYYEAKGEAPGRWLGSGLVGVDGLEAGDVVTAEQMTHLFGSGRDPVSGRPLGSAYKVFTNETADAFTARVDALLANSPKPSAAERAAARATTAHEMFIDEHGREPTASELSAAVARYSRPRRKAVAGFDLTFSPVKSVSTLWAIAPPEVAVRIEEAHIAAVNDALIFIEQHVLFTREGKDGARQVETRGLTAAAFTHRDSRAGDPDLHTHVAVANKVQTKQGKWLSIYGRVLHQHVVAASETYNTALERHLATELGVRFAERPGTERDKRPVREIVGLDGELCDAWSSRRADIVVRQRELAREFRQAHGRPPTPIETVALAQQANLETRERKHDPRSLGEQRATWRAEAVEVLGSETSVKATISASLHPSDSAAVPVTTGWLRLAAARTLAELEQHQAVWQSWHVHAEVQRQIREADIPPEHLPEISRMVTDEVVGLSVSLSPDLDPIDEPGALRRADGASVFRHTGRDRYSSLRVLEAEQRIVSAAAGAEGPGWTTNDVDLGVLAARLDGTLLNPGQEQLVTAMATSGRRVQLALAPAGAGKTRAMRVLAGVCPRRRLHWRCGTATARRWATTSTMSASTRESRRAALTMSSTRGSGSTRPVGTV